MPKKQVGYFADIGIHGDTVSMMCESNTSVNGVFKANVPKDTSVELPRE